MILNVIIQNEHDDEWVINKNVIFDYPVSVDVFKSVDDTSLYMLLSMLSMTSTPVESREGLVFVISPSKRSQSLIVFSRVQPKMSVVTDSSSTRSPHKFFIMHNQRTI